MAASSTAMTPSPPVWRAGMQTEHRLYFACGGGIWTSALDAAETHDGKVIGVDVDQRSKIGERCLTSAMKGLPSAINNALDSYFSGNFSELGGTAQQLLD